MSIFKALKGCYSNFCKGVGKLLTQIQHWWNGNHDHVEGQVDAALELTAIRRQDDEGGAATNASQALRSRKSTSWGDVDESWVVSPLGIDEFYNNEGQTRFT